MRKETEKEIHDRCIRRRKWSVGIFERLYASKLELLPLGAGGKPLELLGAGGGNPLELLGAGGGKPLELLGAGGGPADELLGAGGGPAELLLAGAGVGGPGGGVGPPLTRALVASLLMSHWFDPYSTYKYPSRPQSVPHEFFTIQYGGDAARLYPTSSTQ